MKLTIIERLMALGLLPKEGDFTTLKIVRQVREDLSFSEEEHAALKFESKEDGVLAWQVDGVAADVLNKEIEIGAKASKVIADSLEKLDKEKKLTEQHFSLYEKFCAEQEK